MIRRETLRKMLRSLSLSAEAGGVEVTLLMTAWQWQAFPKRQLGVVRRLSSGGHREGPWVGLTAPVSADSKKKSELRRDGEPLRHLEEKGSSVLLLQGLL